MPFNLSKWSVKMKNTCICIPFYVCLVEGQMVKTGPLTDQIKYIIWGNNEDCVFILFLFRILSLLLFRTKHMQNSVCMDSVL
uniref:Uncharacterized protein n=1 Tax=Anguilla anguilla TaxID=7936 RepID=A0A0E9TJT7_ANGAN